jgi:hypothetical protein
MELVDNLTANDIVIMKKETSWNIRVTMRLSYNN